MRDQLPRKRASSFAVMLLGLLGVALILAAFRIDTPMLSGGNPDTWQGWIHGIACPSENEIWVAELINWRVQKLVTKKSGASTK